MNFELPSGQIIGLIGANGCGKSTTLKLMAGLIHPTAGQVKVLGEPAHRRIGGYVSYMSDSDSLYAFYTAGEIMQFYRNVFPDFDMTKAQEMILMDEPLSGLVPLVRQQILKGLVSFIDLDEQTIIMSTHEVAEIEPLLDSVVLMNEGNVVDIETVDDIRTKHNQVLVDWMTSRLMPVH